MQLCAQGITETGRWRAAWKPLRPMNIHLLRSKSANKGSCAPEAMTLNLVFGPASNKAIRAAATSATALR
uniref:Uncharacterized protein n=1 Tax=Steinernema glaseri TaxID=37863 RepID=A0A1I8AR86_9BILA